MTVAEAYEYMDRSHEMEAELRGEYGMGAVSLGYDAAEWAPAYDGYRCSEDPTYAEAARIVAADHAEGGAGTPVAMLALDASDDLPF